MYIKKTPTSSNDDVKIFNSNKNPKLIRDKRIPNNADSIKIQLGDKKSLTGLENKILLAKAPKNLTFVQTIKPCDLTTFNVSNTDEFFFDTTNETNGYVRNVKGNNNSKELITTQKNQQEDVINYENCKTKNLSSKYSNWEEDEIRNKHRVIQELCRFGDKDFENSDDVTSYLDEKSTELSDLDKNIFEISKLTHYIKKNEPQIDLKRLKLNNAIRNYGRRLPKKRKKVDNIISFVKELKTNNYFSSKLENYIQEHQILETPIFKKENEINIYTNSNNKDDINKNVMECTTVKNEEDSKYELEGIINLEIDVNDKSDVDWFDINETNDNEDNFANEITLTEKNIKEEKNLKPNEEYQNVFEDLAILSSESELEDNEELFVVEEEPVDCYIKLENGFKCKGCDKICTNTLAVVSHYRKHLISSTLCHICGCSFESKDYLRKHLSFSKEKGFCSLKQQSTANETGFIKVGRRERKDPDDPTKKFRKCPHCARQTIPNNYRYYEHLNFHTGETPYVCSCGKSFKYSYNFYAHFDRVKNQNEKLCNLSQCKIPSYAPDGNFSLKQSYQCTFDNCEKSFVTKFKLEDHLNLHTGDNPYFCSCGVNYRYITSLLAHLKNAECNPKDCQIPSYANYGMLENKRKNVKKIDKTQIEEKVKVKKVKKQYKCEECNLSFPGYSFYYAHNIKHLTERNHVCKECNKTFKTLALLNRHIKKVHTTTLLKCEICNDNKKYTKTKHYQHMKIHRSKTNICNICKKEFESRYNMLRHKSQEHKVKNEDYGKYEFEEIINLEIDVIDKSDDDWFDINDSNDNEDNFENEITLTQKNIKEDKNLEPNEEYQNVFEDLVILSSESELEDNEELFVVEEEPVDCYIKLENGFKCKGCDKIFTNTLAVCSHYRKHLIFSTLCHICGCCFESKDYLRKHLSFSKEKGFCNPKQQSTANETGFIKVGRRERKDFDDPTKKFRKCPHCARETIPNNYRYYEHLNFHTGETPYVCSCGKSFKYSYHFYAHFDREKNQNEKLCNWSQCKVPSYAPDRNFSLKQSHQCTFGNCEKSFRIKFQLEDHLNLHTGDNPYFCSCGVNYRYITSLLAHLKNAECNPKDCQIPSYANYGMLENKRKNVKKIDKTEVEEKVKMKRVKKQYKCEECNLSFPGYSSYYKHNIKHLTERNHVCKECSKTFKTLALLNRHIKKFHSTTLFKCEICNNNQKYTKGQHYQHMSIHTSKENCKICNICNKEFESRCTMLRHKSQEHKRVYLEHKIKNVGAEGQMISTNDSIPVVFKEENDIELIICD